MVVAFDANWQVAIALRSGKFNFVEPMGVERVRSRKHPNRFLAEK